MNSSCDDDPSGRMCSPSRFTLEKRARSPLAMSRHAHGPWLVALSLPAEAIAFEATTNGPFAASSSVTEMPVPSPTAPAAVWW